jgi:hypothetical protein
MIDLKSLTNRLGFRRTLHEISLIPLVIFRSILRYNFSVIYFQRNKSDLRGKVPNCSIAFEPRLCALCRPQWVINTLKKVRAASLLLRTYCTFTIFFKNECHSAPQGCQKNWFSNFDLKLSIEIDLNENSLLWMFQIFFICFYPKMRTSNLPVYIEKLFITVS